MEGLEEEGPAEQGHTLGGIQVAPTRVVNCLKEEARVGGVGSGVGDKGCQLCLPADPNTLGFFAIEDLIVHPTRNPSPEAQQQHKQTGTHKRKQ